MSIGRRHLSLAMTPMLVHTGPWHVHAAQAVLRYSCSMQVELLGKRLISYFTEWCGTEYKPTKGSAATDSCWFFVDEGLHEGNRCCP